MIRTSDVTQLESLVARVGAKPRHTKRNALLVCLVLSVTGLIGWLSIERSAEEINGSEHASAPSMHDRGPQRLKAVLSPLEPPVLAASMPVATSVIARTAVPRGLDPADAANEWTLRVRVVDGENRPISNGRIEYVYGNYEVGTLPQVRGVSDSTEIKSEFTELRIPRGTFETRVTAICPGDATGCARIDIADRARKGPPRAIEVVVRASADEMAPFISGEMKRRDGGSLPKNLEVWLVPIKTKSEREATRSETSETPPARRAPLAPRSGRQPIACRYDRENARYRGGPLTEGLWGLRVIGDGIAPNWFPLERVAAPIASFRKDITLDEGATLRLTAVYDDGTPAAGTRFRCHGTALTWNSVDAGRRLENWELFAATGDDGTCTFAGMPYGEAAFVGRASGNEFAEDLLRINVPIGSERRVERRVVLTRHDTIVAWGPVPQPTAFGIDSFDGTTLEIYASDRRGAVYMPRKPRSIQMPLGEERWVVRLPVIAAGWDLFLTREGRRISSVVSVPAASSSEVGPLTLEPLEPREASVRWHDAPPDWTLRMLATNRDGPIGKLFETTLNGAEGEAKLTVDDDVPVEVCVLRTWATNIRFGVPARRATTDTGFDLHARHRTRLNVHVNGTPLDGDGEICIASAESPLADLIELRAQIAFESGRSVEDVPLPPGRYFYRVNSASCPGVVCGWFEVREPLPGANAETLIDWNGKLVAPSAVVAGAPPSVEITECAGTRVPAHLPSDWRRFSFGEFRYSALETRTQAPPVFASPANDVLLAATSLD